MRRKTRDVKHVKSVLEELLLKWERGTARRGTLVNSAWSAAVDKKTEEHARPVNFRNGILMVIVKNAPWLYKLTLEKKNIIKKFNENYKGRKKASDIRFRVGSVNE